MPRIRLTSTYTPEPGRTLYPGHTFDATDEQAERLLALDGAVETSPDDETPDAAKHHLTMLEEQKARMEEEHQALVDGSHPERVVTLSASRLQAQDQALAKARERAGVKQPKRAKPAASGADPAPADAQAAAAGVSSPTA